MRATAGSRRARRFAPGSSRSPITASSTCCDESGREVSVDAFDGDGDEPWQPEAAAWQHWPAPAGAAPQGDELAFWRRAGEKLLDLPRAAAAAAAQRLPAPSRRRPALDEVAHALEVGFETAKTRLRYAMSKLRTCMGAYLEPGARRRRRDERRRTRRLAARSAAPCARFGRRATDRAERCHPGPRRARPRGRRREAARAAKRKAAARIRFSRSGTGWPARRWPPASQA